MSLLLEISEILCSRLQNNPQDSAHTKLMELAIKKGVPEDIAEELPDLLEEFVQEFIIDNK